MRRWSFSDVLEFIGNKCPPRLSESAQCEKATGGIYFTETWWPEALQPAGLEIGKLQTRSKKASLHAVLAERFIFLTGG
jgi:hypothetical protein